MTTTAHPWVLSAGSQTVVIEIACVSSTCAWRAVHRAETDEEGHLFLAQRLQAHLEEQHPQVGGITTWRN